MALLSKPISRDNIQPFAFFLATFHTFVSSVLNFSFASEDFYGLSKRELLGRTGAIIKLAFQTKLEFFTTGANDQ